MNQISIAENIIIPGGGSLPRVGLGNFLYLIEANGPLVIRSNFDADKPFDVGTGINYGENSRSFNRLQIVNDNAGPVAVTVYRGFARYVDRRLNTTEFRRNTTLPIVKLAQCIVSMGRLDLSEDDEIIVPNDSGSQQKIGVFCVTEANLRVYNDTDDLIFSIIAPARSVRYFITSQALKFVQGAVDGSYTFFRTKVCASASSLFFGFEDGTEYLFEDGEQKEFQNT